MMKRLLCLCFSVMLMITSTAYAQQVPEEINPIPYDELPEPLTGQHHYLLACIDNWDGDVDQIGNTDGVVVVTMDTQADRLLFTTFMREMLIQRPDGNPGRITYLTKNYGPETLAETISTHFGIKVEKYILFNMNNVQDIIDAMGGVYITVTDAEATYLNNYRISRDSTTPSMDKGGTYLFGGHAAVIYMRIRKVGGDGDAGRTQRIRTVLSTLATQLQEISLDGALTILDMVVNNQVQTNMSLTDMIQAVGYAMDLRGVEPEDLQMPTNESMTPITYAAMATNEVDFELCREVLAAFLAGDTEE